MARNRSIAVRLIAPAAVLLCMGSIGLAAPGGGATPATVASTGTVSVRNSPGYVPLVDPESLSVVLGRRLNAPLVRKPFHGGATSLDQLGRAVCRALHHEASDSLLALCVREDEFRDILWREFPQSRPATGLQWEDAWTFLGPRLDSGCRGALGDFGGRYLEFVRFESADTTARYRNFKLHNGLVLVTRNDRGEIEKFSWLRSVAERKGRFKIYSVSD